MASIVDKLDGLCSWFRTRPNQGAAILVLVAGTIGGLSAPLLYQLAGKEAFPTLQWWELIFCGVLAAGFGSILFSIANRSDQLHFFFVALASAIVFPVVLGQLFPPGDGEAIAQVSDAEDLKKQTNVVDQISTNDLTDKGKTIIQAKLSESLDKETETVVSSLENANQQVLAGEVKKKVTEITDLGKSAGEKGLSVTRTETIEALKTIQEAVPEGNVELQAELESAISDVAAPIAEETN